MAETVDTIVVGAGVVGLACAAALAKSGREVMVLEAAEAIGAHTSSRNSEVIHAGIYYQTNSLKAQLCRKGRDMLYTYAKDRAIPYKQTGKIIVATASSQLSRLTSLIDSAEANDVTDLRYLERDDIQAMEPEVKAVAGLYSPSTGIVDSHALMVALEGDLDTHGGMVVLHTPVKSAAVTERGIRVQTGGEMSIELDAKLVVNSAGLMAPQLAGSILGFPQSHIPTAHYAIGHYYRLSGKSPCSHLIYPVPEPGGLGVHLTLDLGGQTKFGPDVRWLDKIDYAFDDSKAEDFLASIQNYLPTIVAEKLSPDYTGIRPKIVGQGEDAADFRIEGPETHGAGGLINLFGIESPGLTASLAIGDYVAEISNY